MSFLHKEIEIALTFDDVLLKPQFSEIIPSEVDTSTLLARDLRLAVPLISSAMDTVTESRLAIAMAQQGGIGCIHKNLSIEAQSEEVRKVKRFEAGMVTNPVTLTADATLQDALTLMNEQAISSIPVLNKQDRTLQGILTNRDVRFAENPNQAVTELMTKENLITVKKGIKREEAKKLLHQHRLEKLIVTNDKNQCIGLITVKDIENETTYPKASKDKKGRLLVAGAVGTGTQGKERAESLLEAGIDMIIVDTAHGHSKGVLDMVSLIRKMDKNIVIVGGNIATKEGAKALHDAGADIVKVGIGPGSICTTRIIAGVGVPQLTAVMEVSDYCKRHKMGLIADGGIKYSGDIAKAIAAGADCVMIGSLLAGTEESPGEVVLYQGRSYKTYRGMGSVGAMARGSADRYFQQEIENKMKYVPEGVEGRVPFKGAVSEVLYQLTGGLRAAMGYTGNDTIVKMQKNSQFVHITGAGLKESHVHDVSITHETPNYRHD